jgi:hypothetical protein
MISKFAVLKVYIRLNISGKTSEVVKPKGKEFPIDTVTHDIRDYMPLLHKQRKSEDPEHVRLDNLRTLRKLLRKL